MKSNSRVLRGWRDFGVKATAIILTILLATQMVGTPAFASGALTNKQASEDIATTVDDTGVEPSGTEATDTTVPDEAAGAANEPAPADSTQATEEPVVETVESATEPATETPAADPAANAVLGTEPEPTADSGSEPAPAVEQNQLASIELNLADGASITLSKDGNKIDDDTNPVDVPANEELKFTAAAPEGMQISAVKTFINGVESDPIAADENGEYKVAADKVTDKLTVKVEAAEVAEDPVAEEATDDAVDQTESTKPLMASARMLKASTSVDVQLRLYNTDNQIVKTISYSFTSGDINAETAPTADDIPDLTGYYFTDATVDDADGRTEIKYVESQNGETFYAFIEDPTYGVGLAEGETIYFNYMANGNTVPVNVETSGATDVEGNTVNAAGRATKGSDFSFNVSTARGYTAEVTVNGEPVKSDTGAYTTRIAENADAVQISVEFVADESVIFDPGVFNQQNYKYLYEGGSADAYGVEGGTNGSPRFRSSTLSVQEKNVGSDGANFTFEFTTSGNWQCDSFQINGAYIQIPQTRTVGASAETVLYSDDTGQCVATFALTGITGENATYRLTITGAKENLTITAANLNGGGWSEVIPTATEGIWFKSSASKNGHFEDGGLNEPYATAGGGTPKFQFGLDEGYKNLAVDIIGYTGDDEVAYEQRVELPRAGETSSVSVRYQYWQSGIFGGHWQTATATVATITGNYDGSYTIQYSNNSAYNGKIELQFLEITCDLATYGVVYDDGAGGNAPIDDQTYDVVANSTVVVTSGSPEPPAGKKFSGWTIEGDGSGKVYYAGDAINLTDPEINDFISENAGEGKDGVLRFNARYVDTLQSGEPIQVPVYYQVQNDDGSYKTVNTSYIGGKVDGSSYLRTYDRSG